MDTQTIVTAVGSLAAGIFGAIVTGMFGRRKARSEAHRVDADADVRSSEGFKLLVDEMRKERIELTLVIERQGAKIEVQSENINRLEKKVSKLESVLEDLLLKWRRGDPAPPHMEIGNQS